MRFISVELEGLPAAALAEAGVHFAARRQKSKARFVIVEAANYNRGLSRP
jgi:hypothetical protein